MNPFKVGDLVKVINQPSNFSYVERESNNEFDPYMTFVVVRINNSDIVSIRPEGFVGERLVALFTDRIEPFAEWAKHQKPADNAADVDKALGLTGYIAARQRAFDLYAESRRKNVLPAPSPAEFNTVYALGYENGLQKHKAAVFASQNLTPLSRAGEKAPAISKEKTGKLGDLVLMSLQTQGPGTAQEVADRIGEPLNAVSPRFATLKRRGLIHVSSGQRVGRGTRSVYSIGGGPL